MYIYKKCDFVQYSIFLLQDLRAHEAYNMLNRFLSGSYRNLYRFLAGPTFMIFEVLY